MNRNVITWPERGKINMMHSDSRVKEPVCLATTSLPDPCLSTYLSPRLREEPEKRPRGALFLSWVATPPRRHWSCRPIAPCGPVCRELTPDWLSARQRCCHHSLFYSRSR